MAVSANLSANNPKETGLYLRYGRRPQGPRDKVQAVLWPVWVHKILYPEVQQPKMNLFQKVVLRLIRAKTHDAEDISQLTGMHWELVKLIQTELLSRGWLNDQATELTEKGIKAINEEDEQSEQLASGYLFQDAFTGELWPRIEKQLNILEAIDPNARYPEFRRDRKTGYIFKPYKLDKNYQLQTQPTTQIALKAWQDYRSDYRAARQLYGGNLPKQIASSGIRLQDTSAELGWVVVWITPSNSSSLWSIKDPFDIRDEAWWLKDGLLQRLEDDYNLLKILSRQIDEPEPENQTVSEWLASLQEQAQLQVMLNYPWASKEPDIVSAISVLLTRKETIKKGQNYENDLEAAVTESQKLLEVLMQWLIKTYLANTDVLPQQYQISEELKIELLVKLELPAITDSVAQRLSYQEMENVVKALDVPSSSLKALVFAAALGTVGNSLHPLKTLTDEQLQLESLLNLADLRNQTSHGKSRYTGKDYKKITKELALEQLDYALSFTEQFKEWING